MHGKGKQACATAGFKAFHRFHQADIAFLNQIGLVQTIAVVTACNRHHHAQMGQNQFFGRFQITGHMALGQIVLFFGTQ